MRMEYVFNLVWALAATASVYFWLKSGQRSPRAGHSPLVGLAMLVVILFPVISVSDDLWSLQNPVEINTCHRRDQCGGVNHTHFPAPAALPEAVYAEQNSEFWLQAIPQLIESHASSNPAFGFIENRPPPAL
jgi:hypothetical protein